ncbi:hypothetical protein O3P69_006466 [Scylla paramamosain]|uniref:RGS domain-containing protein n=1 Tax=Scylla paramamosain TaxID=85552 RepID=A0AAW0U4D8_SCYPA
MSSPTKGAAQPEKWSSTTGLLADPEGVEVFRDFLVELDNESGKAGEHTKYIDFYLECEQYKASIKELVDKGNKIYKDYLEYGANKKVRIEENYVKISEKLKDKDLVVENLLDELQQKAKQKLDDPYNGIGITTTPTNYQCVTPNSQLTTNPQSGLGGGLAMARSRCRCFHSAHHISAS